MAKRTFFDYPIGVVAEALSTFWVRLLLFTGAIVGGTAIASAIRPIGHFNKGLMDGLRPLLWAPVAWLFSPIYLVADGLTVIFFYVLMRTESPGRAVACIVGVGCVWLGHGLAMWP
jgi:hypothetical protein